MDFNFLHATCPTYSGEEKPYPRMHLLAPLLSTPPFTPGNAHVDAIQSSQRWSLKAVNVEKRDFRTIQDAHNGPTIRQRM